MESKLLLYLIKKFGEDESVILDNIDSEAVILEDAWELASDALDSLAPNILESDDESVINSYNIIKEYVKLKNKTADIVIEDFSL